MEKHSQNTFGGIDQDTSKSKHQPEMYYNARHIKLNADKDGSSHSLINEKGNKLKLTFPNVTIDQSSNSIIYGNNKIQFSTLVNGLTSEIKSFGNIILTNHTIIGSITTRDGIAFITDSNEGINIIWHLTKILEDKYELKLLYLNKLSITKDNPVQLIFHYENESINKIYFTDGINQIRYINLTHDLIEGNNPLINLPKSSLNFTGDINFTKPIVNKKYSLGSHTSGMIQYAYNLFSLNGSESKISPLSDLIPLDKGINLGGGEVNEVVGQAPEVRISNVDRRFTHVKLYAIKYTSYGQIPSIGLILEREISDEDILYIDDGSVLDEISIEEFLFLGNDPVIAKHIEVKDSRLIVGNIQSKDFIIPEELDTRAFSFRINSSSCLILNDVSSVANQAFGNGQISVTDVGRVPPKHSSINVNYDVYRYQKNSNILGGTGKYFNYELVQMSKSNIMNRFRSTNLVNDSTLKVFKDNEIYRIGIVFYNRLGQQSLPKWIADFKTPIGNLEDKYNLIKISPTNEFKNFLDTYKWSNEDNRITGYRIVRAVRNESDKTILYQGAMSNMVFQSKDRKDIDGNSNWQNTYKAIGRKFQDLSPKFPSWNIRHPEVYPRTSYPNDNTIPYGYLNGLGHLIPLNQEIFTSKSTKGKMQASFSHDKMIQMYSPEISFFKPSTLSNNLQVSVKGFAGLTDAGAWWRELFNDTRQERYSAKLKGGINPYLASKYKGASILSENDLNNATRGHSSDKHYVGNRGYIQIPRRFDSTKKRLSYRSFTNFKAAPRKNISTIYGSPEFSERGHSERSYNDDSRFKYSNTLQSIITDIKVDGTDHTSVSTVNSYGADAITFVLGVKDWGTSGRLGLREMYTSSGISGLNMGTDGVIIGEIIKPYSEVYLSNIYGGNSYEDKLRTEYIQIGDYKDIEFESKFNDPNNERDIIFNPGDTMVGNFKILRINRTDIESFSTDIFQMVEIIEFKCETSVDIPLRNDKSKGDWDAEFQPDYKEYHKYNKVYSQQPNLVKSRNVDFKFKRIDNFDTRVMASKSKVSNESIDSWTDILQNEVIDLNGKYGAVNNIISFKDNIYAFQDKAISVLQINPRVQIQTSDSIGLELGSGSIMYGYEYLTTNSGSMNKWGIVTGKKGIYYYDILNKSLGRVNDATEFSLSTIKGLNSFYKNNTIYESLVKDNPIKREGVILGIDPIRDDVYVTLLQNKTLPPNFNIGGGNSLKTEDVSNTFVFNELRDNFVDQKLYNNNLYLNFSDKFITSDNSKTLYESFAGSYNEFNGQYYPSSITFLINPEAHLDKIFNTIHFNSEVTLGGVDIPTKTITHITAWNEYQNSGRIKLNNGRGSNLSRRFREWNASIPRDGRIRMRNQWLFLKLEFDFRDGLNIRDSQQVFRDGMKIILHDVIVSYDI